MSEKALSYDLDFEKRSGYLYASLACRELDPSTCLEILGEILAQAAEVRRKRVMVHCDLASIENDDDLLKAMLDLASMRSGSKICFVNCRTSDHEHPAISDDFKLFDDSESAEKWLLAD